MLLAGHRSVPCLATTRQAHLPHFCGRTGPEARAIADLVERMLAVPEEDVPGAWERRCATWMRIAPIANSSKVFTDHGAVDPVGQRAARPDRPCSEQAANRSLYHVAQHHFGERRDGRIPEIAHYEVRRELFRIRGGGSARIWIRFGKPSSSSHSKAMSEKLNRSGLSRSHAIFWPSYARAPTLSPTAIGPGGESAPS